MGLQTFYGKGPHRLLWAGSRSARAKIMVIGVPDCLNCCVIFYYTYTAYKFGRSLETHALSLMQLNLMIVILLSCFIDIDKWT
jgi:hypothetical protein